jgi:hypothetical protein
MNFQEAWATQRAQYSRARRGRTERGANLVECALVQATAQAVRLRQMGYTSRHTSIAAHS